MSTKGWGTFPAIMAGQCIIHADTFLVSAQRHVFIGCGSALNRPHPTAAACVQPQSGGAKSGQRTVGMQLAIMINTGWAG